MPLRLETKGICTSWVGLWHLSNPLLNSLLVLQSYITFLVHTIKSVESISMGLIKPGNNEQLEKDTAVYRASWMRI